MKGICCICRRTIGAGRSAGKRLVASFTPSHFGLCPTCLGRTREDIARIYGQVASGATPGEGNPATAGKVIAA